MASSSARFLFVVVLVINALLWSHSRYGYTLHSSSLVPGEPSLVRRISYELSNPPTIRDSNDLDDQCRPLAYPVDEQCLHVKEECEPSSTFLGIDYLRHYFCTPIHLRPLLFASLITWLVFLFSTLGISASDFFTPNLATIAQLLGLDENLAGVTFLAFGNGSPDVFSTFSAMRADSGSLAIGELLGASSFIVSFVVGSMCIIKPFKVHRKPFLRDVGFFTTAVLLVLVILWDGEIRLWEALLLIGLYVLYALIVVVGAWWDRRQEGKRELDAIIRSEYEDDNTIFDPYRDDPSPTPAQSTITPIASPTARVRAVSAPVPPRLETNLPPRPHSRSPSPTPSHSVAQLPSFSLVGALEFRDVVASLRQSAAVSSLSIFESPVTPYAGGHYHSRSLALARPSRASVSSRDGEQWDATLNDLPLDDRSPQRLPVPLPRVSVSSPDGLSDQQGQLHPPNTDYFDFSHGNDDRRHTPVPSIFRTPASPTASESTSTETQLYSPPSKRQRFFHALYRIYHTLFPTLHQFQRQSILGQIAGVFAAPAVLMLTLTLPVVVTAYEDAHAAREKTRLDRDGRLVDFEEEGVERALIAEEEVEENLHELTFNKWLMAAQCVLGPLFCAQVLFGNSRKGMWIMLATAITGIAVGTLVIMFADKGNHPTARMARCSMGFFVAIVWIMAIADEVVNVLLTFGFIFGLSDAIIGLTIFAVGNSLADLVANMSVAVFAPIMGFSACFGGPMLNILLGVGISGTYIIHQSSQAYKLALSTTLFVSTIGLLVLLVSTLIFVPLNDYFLSRRWGILLVVSYLVIMLVNVIVELKS